MSTTVRYTLTTTAPMPDALAEQIHRYTSSQAWSDPWRSDHTGVVHVLTAAPLADEAAGFFLDHLNVPYEVRGEASA